MNAQDIDLALRSRAAFTDSIEHLDADTRRRLREARLRALRDGPQRASARWVWPAGAALAAALALAMFLPRLPQAPTTPLPAASSAVASQLVTPTSTAPEGPNPVTEAMTAGTAEAPSVEAADPDMLSELDFYGWLAKQQDAGKTGG